MMAAEREPRLVAVYDYHDADGKLLYQVLRYDSPKNFKQGRPDGNGGYIWNLAGVGRVPYRLPQLLRRVAKGHTVFVVEGEKDADALDSLRLCATTNAGGANWTWTPKFVEYFRGAKRPVVVIPDCDEGVAKASRKGREVGADHATRLLNVCDDVRLLDLDRSHHDGYDISDWLADGHQIDDLQVLLRATPRFYAPAPIGLEHSQNGQVQVTPVEDVDWDDARPWPTLDSAAFHGIAGDIVRAAAQQTEADPAAMLFTLLAAVGNVIGHERRALVHYDEHPARFDVAIVGDTASGAKGMSWGTIRPFLRAAAPGRYDARIPNGFGSGESVISELQPGADGTLADPRVFVVETEFARLLTVSNRDGSTMSMILRQAWDGGTLAVRRAKDRVVATGAHVSVVGHITPDELRASLTTTDTTNGFGNRFLYVLSQRSKKLPSGGYIDPVTIASLGKRLSSVLRNQRPRTFERTDAAQKLWRDLYHAEEDRDGMVGALAARWHAQRLRLSVAFASTRWRR